MKKIIISLVSITTAFAQTEDSAVPFGTSFSANSSQHILWTSDGTPDNDGGTNLDPSGSAALPSGQINYTIGYFNSGFAPTQSNYASWASNYNQVDSAYHLDYGLLGWYIQDNYTPVASAAANQQIWVFAYNDLASIGTSAGEALLFSDGQSFPTANTVTIDVSDSPAADDDNFDIVWGRADRAYLDNMGNAIAGGIVEGGGYFSGQPAEGAFEIQTYSWEPVGVPEPSTSLLLFGGIAGLITRRKR